MLTGCPRPGDPARPAPPPNRAPATSASTVPAQAPAASGAPAASTTTASAALAPTKTSDAMASLRERLGRCVMLEGYALGSHKLGPSLLTPKFTIGVVPRAGSWSPELPGSHVRVEGVVAEQSDLPVFHPRPGEPEQQGIPVPEGTSLDEARKRLVLEDATVTRLRSTTQVQKELVSHLGERVRLAGIVWSLNGHYWFNHDTIDMHVEGLTELPEWSTALHGQLVTIEGRLQRKPMPRIDQIVLKPKRDLADAFVLSEPSLGPAPAWAPAACQR
jgi:hypothetical protein